VLVYSVAEPLAPASDAEIRTIFRRIENKYEMANKKTAPVVVLAANMINRSDRVVSPEFGNKIAGELGIKYFETSAKTNTNIDEMFQYIIQTLKSEREQRAPRPKRWYEKCSLL
jgi:Fe2+ transport system protein B